MSNSKISRIYEDIIQDMITVYKHDDRPWMIGFSGGKDSTLLCCLVFEMLKRLTKKDRNKTVYIVSSDTRVENPIVRDYMHKMSGLIMNAGREYNVKASVIYPEAKDSFWCKIIGLGYITPEAPGFRWCTERLKIRPMNKFVSDVIKNKGEIVLLLGVRKAESVYRARNIKEREIEGKLLVPHNDIVGAYVYNPLTEIPNEAVWEFLLKDDGITPWGSDNKYLFSLYQGENLGEEYSVIGEIDKNKIPITGNSRFGCWICTMVKEDKSLKTFIDKGESWLEPLRDFRNWLLTLRNDNSKREMKRRNGSVYKTSDGNFGYGPFKLETRKEILRKLLELEQKTGLELIGIDELKEIDRLWDLEGDLSRRCLVDIYSAVKGNELPWDTYKSGIYSEDTINEVKQACGKYDVPFDLISQLIIGIEKNKNYTHSAVITKEIDRILNQGWLHYESIEKGVKHDNQAD